MSAIRSKDGRDMMRYMKRNKDSIHDVMHRIE